MSSIIRSIVFILFISACSPKVINYVSPKADFSSYHTYFITNVKIRNADLSADGKDIINHIEQAAKNEMNRRNYKVSNQDADLVLRYEIISNQVTDVNTNNSYYGFYPRFPYNTITVRTFLESAILFELTDLKTKKAIWHASIDLNQYKKEKKADEVIQRAVSNLFDTYLYKAGSHQIDETLITR